jgi:hypothetical protein
VLAVTAAAAVLFETVPVLRGGLGNVVWFFFWMFAAIAGGGGPLGGLGTVAASMRQAMAAQHIHSAGQFSLGFTKLDHPLRTFSWAGLHPSAGFVAARLVLILVAAGLAAGPAVWFGRFDPARAGRRRPVRRDAGPVPASVPPGAGAGLADPGLADAGPAEVGHGGRAALSYRPLSPVARGRAGLAAGRLLAGEARILVQGVSRWWWLAAAGLTVLSLAVPRDLVRPAGASTALLLSAAWIWPILIWSRLGTQRRENGLDSLLGAYPGRHRQLAAEWLAGLALTVALGLGPLLSMLIAGDSAGAAAWAGGALFIPSLALLLGTVSGTHRVFQVLYLILWYAVVNHVAAADYMGTVLVHGRPAGPGPVPVAGAGVLTLGATFAVRWARHAAR